MTQGRREKETVRVREVEMRERGGGRQPMKMMLKGTNQFCYFTSFTNIRSMHNALTEQNIGMGKLPKAKYNQTCPPYVSWEHYKSCIMDQLRKSIGKG